ncbi:MAG: ATP-binding protein [Gemmatimonadales bacterium]
MNSVATSAVGLIGILVELGACLLATSLMFGLRRQARDREYFTWWSWAWIAVSVAVAAVSIRYNVLPQVVPAAIRRGEGPFLVPLYAAYQIAKFLFLGFTALGVRSWLTGISVTRREAVGVWLTAVSVGFGSVLFTVDLNHLVMIQAVIFGPTFGILAWYVGRQPRSPREVGSRTLTVALVLLAVQWTLYLVAFGRASIPASSRFETILGNLAEYNSYLDAGTLVLLGVAMVLTLVEQTHRETQAWQGDRIRDAKAAERRLAEVLRAAHEGVVTLTADRTIDLMNPAAETILGVSRTEVRGASFDRFVRPEDRAPFWNDLALTVRRSESHPAVATRREVGGIRANDDPFPLELSASSLADDAGGGYVMVVRDLTNQLREREAHEQFQNQLAHAARLEAMGRMVSGVAHELNNPLTAIIAFAQDLAMQPRSDDDREALTVIIQQADRCRIIVGDLLIFARSRREERRRLAPEDLVRRVARVFDRDSARFGVILGVQVGAELPSIEVDAAGIEQVLTNLLTNAFQASPPSGRVDLSVDTKGDRIEFRVEDQGAGIAPETLPRVFEPFFTTKPTGQGTGLGLAVSHAIVQQHGGTITAENRDGGEHGARFIVRLPYVNRRTDHAAPGGPGTPAAGIVAHGSRALVVDDEPAIRVAIRRALERHGWVVDEAADGSEAWLRLQVGGRPADYAVIVTDLRMPGLSGIELVERLRIEHPSLAARTIVITGDTASPQVAQFLATLTTPYLQKPFDIKAIVTWADRIRRESTLPA